MIICSPNHPVCPHVAIILILLLIIPGSGPVQRHPYSWKIWAKEKTEKSLCIIIMPLEQVISTASRSNYAKTDLFVSLCTLLNAHLLLHCRGGKGNVRTGQLFPDREQSMSVFRKTSVCLSLSSCAWMWWAETNIKYIKNEFSTIFYILKLTDDKEIY